MVSVKPVTQVTTHTPFGSSRVDVDDNGHDIHRLMNQAAELHMAQAMLGAMFTPQPQVVFSSGPCSNTLFGQSQQTFVSSGPVEGDRRQMSVPRMVQGTNIFGAPMAVQQNVMVWHTFHNGAWVPEN